MTESTTGTWVLLFTHYKSGQLYVCLSPKFSNQRIFLNKLIFIQIVAIFAMHWEGRKLGSFSGM